MSTVLVSPEQTVEVDPVVFAALSVAGKKMGEQVRKQVRPGKRHVDATVRVQGWVNVGHDGQSASSVTPDQNDLVAYLLSKINKRTREQVIRDLPEKFASLGRVPVVDKQLTAQSADLLGRLRRKVMVPRAGAVRGDLTVEVESCQLDGATEVTEITLPLSAYRGGLVKGGSHE